MGLYYPHMSSKKGLKSPLHNYKMQLMDAAVELEKGKLETRVDIKSDDEMGILAACFNQMAQNLQQAGENLQESEERFRSVVESANEAIIIIDKDNNIIFWNLQKPV